MYDVDNIMSKSRSEMIKFVLVFIAVILMALGIYNYSNQNTEIHTPKPTISEKKKAAKEIEKVSVVTQEVKEKKSSAKNTMAQSPKVVLQETTQEMESEEDIGKALTLESIKNTDMSDEEKERMIDDMVYHKDLNIPADPTLGEEEILKIINEDNKD